MKEKESKEKEIKSFLSGLQSRDVIKLMEALEGVRLSFDQLYYYEHTGLIVPSIRKSQGRGVPRLYSVEDFIILRWLVQLNKNGIPVNQFREVIGFLRKKMPEILKNPLNWVLITDGNKIKFFDKISSRTLDIIEDSAQYLFVFPIGNIAKQSEVALDTISSKPKKS